MRYLLLFLFFVPFPIKVLAELNDSLLMQVHIAKAEKLYFEGGSSDSIFYHFEVASNIAKEGEYWRPYVYIHLAQFQVNNTFLNFEKIEYFALKALELARKHLEVNDDYQSAALNNLGIYYAHKKDFIKAIEFSKKDLEFQRNKPSSPSKFKIMAYIRLAMGGHYNSLGDYGRALSSFKESVSILQDSLSNDPETVRAMGNGLWNIGTTYYRLKEYELAIKSFEEAYFFVQKEDRDNSFLLIRICQSLSNTYLESENVDKSLETMKLIDPLQANYKKNRNEFLEGEFYFQIKGLIYKSLKQVDKAEESFIQAISEAKVYYSTFERHNRIGYALMQYADFLAGENRNLEALENYNHALFHYTTCNDSIQVFETPQYQEIPVATEELVLLLRNRAYLLMRLYHKMAKKKILAAAWKSSLLQIGLIDEIRKSLRAEGSQLFLASQALPSYEQAIDIAIKLYNQTKEEKYRLRAFSIAEKGKSVLLYSSLQESSARLSIPLTDSLVLLENQLRQDLSLYRSRIFEEENKNPKQEKTELKDWKRKVFTINEKLVAIRDQLQNQNPTYFTFAFSPEIESLEEIRARLADDQGLLEYFWGDSSIYIFYTDQGNLNIRELERSEKLDTHLRSFLAQLHSKSEEFFDTFVSDAAYLYTVLLAPEIMEFGPAKLKIVPDGPLGHLSFDVLLSGDAHVEKDFRSLPYLGQKLSISYAYSGSLMLMNNGLKEEGMQKNWLGFAPSFFKEVSLSFNVKEVESIRTNIERGVSFLSNKATSEAFKEYAPQYRILHVSTHGYPELTNPAFARLIFASEDGENDSHLYAHEIAELPLQADLAVLSACESGYGDWAKGEGIMSLARAFRFAGCRSILSSLWKAEGAATKALMEGFYAAYNEGFSKDEALQKAKFEFLASAKPNQVHPKHWGNFVLMGDVEGKANWWDWGKWVLLGFGVMLVIGGGVVFGRLRR